MVGTRLGAAEGVSGCAAVGDCDSVGVMVGKVVGFCVGTLDGKEETVDDSVGTREGVTEGFWVVASVGECDSVGAIVGAIVGF